MADESQIPDDEVLLRRVPPGPSWIKEGSRLTSGNFCLRRGESGISVSQGSITTPADLLGYIEAPTGWRVALVRAGDVRALGLDVARRRGVGDPDPGHAEIIPARRPLSQAVRKRLATLFKLLPESETRSE